MIIAYYDLSMEFAVIRIAAGSIIRAEHAAGMPDTFRMEEHGPRKLRIAMLHGVRKHLRKTSEDDIEEQ